MSGPPSLLSLLQCRQSTDHWQSFNYPFAHIKLGVSLITSHSPHPFTSLCKPYSPLIHCKVTLLVCLLTCILFPFCSFKLCLNKPAFLHLHPVSCLFLIDDFIGVIGHLNFPLDDVVRCLNQLTQTSATASSASSLTIPSVPPTAAGSSIQLPDHFEGREISRGSKGPANKVNVPTTISDLPGNWTSTPLRNPPSPPLWWHCRWRSASGSTWQRPRGTRWSW